MPKSPSSWKEINSESLACMRACVCACVRVRVCVCMCVRERRKIELTVRGKKVPIPLDGIRTCFSGILAHSASDYTTRVGPPRVSRSEHFRRSPASSTVKQSCMKTLQLLSARPRRQALEGPPLSRTKRVRVRVCVCGGGGGGGGGGNVGVRRTQFPASFQILVVFFGPIRGGLTPSHFFFDQHHMYTLLKQVSVDT